MKKKMYGLGISVILSPSSPLPTQVEKLFTVKPGASPDQIKISLSGVGEEFGI